MLPGPFYTPRSILCCQVHSMVPGPFYTPRSILCSQVHSILPSPFYSMFPSPFYALKSILCSQVHSMFRSPFYVPKSILFSQVHSMLVVLPICTPYVRPFVCTYCASSPSLPHADQLPFANISRIPCGNTFSSGSGHTMALVTLIITLVANLTTRFPSEKASMSTFRHARKTNFSENASERIHSHWQIFCVVENAQ